MGRLLTSAIALALATTAGAAGYENTTRAKYTLGSMFTQSGNFGFPPYSADPFACTNAVTAERSVYYNTTTHSPRFCNGTSWVESSASFPSATLGSELAAIDATCTGWTLGTNWVCGGDGTIRHNAGAVAAVPPNGARYNVAAVPGTTYQVVVTASSGTYAGVPSTRPFLVQIGDSPSGFVFSDGTHTFYQTAALTTAVTLGTEANGTTIAGNFAVSVRAIVGGGATIPGGATFNGPLTVNGVLSFPGGVSLETNSSGLSMYLGRMVAKSRQADLFGNLCVGGMSCYNITSGGDNTCLGTNTCSGISDGGYNTVVGVDAGMRFASSTNNTCSGKVACWGITGNENAGYGALTMYSTGGTGTAAQNSTNGYATLYSITSGAYNFAGGWKAGYGVTSGLGHVIIGSEAGYNTGSTASTANAVTTAASGFGPGTYVGYRAGHGSAVQLGDSSAIGANAYVTEHHRFVLGSKNLVDVMAGSQGQATIESAGLRGAHVKTLTDGAAAATVGLIPLAYSNYEAGLYTWSAESTDATDYRQVAGVFAVNGIKKGSTPQCAIDTVPMSAAVTLALSSNANVVACTWTVAVSGTDCALQAACTDDTAGTQTITARVKPFMTTLSPGNIVWP